MANTELLIGVGVAAVLILVWYMWSKKHEGYCSGQMDMGEAAFVLNQDLVGVQFTPTGAEGGGRITYTFAKPINPSTLRLNIGVPGYTTYASLSAFVPTTYNGVLGSVLIDNAIKTKNNSYLQRIAVGNGLVDSLSGVADGHAPLLPGLQWSSASPNTLTITVSDGSLAQEHNVSGYKQTGLYSGTPIAMTGNGTIRFRVPPPWVK